MDYQVYLNNIVSDMFSLYIKQNQSSTFRPTAQLSLTESEILNKVKHLDSINRIDRFGATLLNYATTYQMNYIVVYLVQHGADLNHQDKRGYTPLHAAVENSNIVALELLLQNGANPNLRDKFGNTPLMRAKHYMSDGIFRLLISFGANPHLENNYGVSPVRLFEAYPHIVNILTHRE